MIRLFGTPVQLHPLFVFILFFSVITGNFIELFTLFGIVLIHELGHAWAARSIGWHVHSITLLPFGGVAEIDQRGTWSANHEIFVALSGPMQHAWLIAFSIMMNKLGIWTEDWGAYFIRANVMILLFNLMPIHPLDGGKILQTIMSLVLPYYRAIQASSWSGVISSALIVIYTLITSGHGFNLNLFAIGCFLLYSNVFTLRHLIYQHIRFLMSEQLANRIAEQPILIIAHQSDTLSSLVKRLYRGKKHLIYVLDAGGKIRNVVRENELIQLYFQKTKFR